MEQKLNVLITGGGAPGISGTIFSLKHNTDQTLFKIVSCDISDNVVGKYLADTFYRVPSPESKDYISCIEQIVIKEKIKVIIPQTTREVIKLSRFMRRFSRKNVVILTSDYQNIRIANDKFLLLGEAQKIGIPTPKFFLCTSKTSLKDALRLLGYPNNKVVIKPRISNGMRGLRILTEQPWNVNRFVTEKPEGTEINVNNLFDILKRGIWPELLVTEYLFGEEYSVDVFRSNNETVIIPRLRARVRSGITFDAKVVFRKDIIKYSKKLSEVLNLKYCFGFQFKLGVGKVPFIIECNPRVQGTMVVSGFAGFNVIYYSVMNALGRKVSLPKAKLREVYFKRYWGGVAVYENAVIGKI